MSLLDEESPARFCEEAIWSELITMQQEQLRLLTELMKEHLSADGNHPATG